MRKGQQNRFLEQGGLSMTIDEIIKKWRGERDRLSLKMEFCIEHNLPHELEFVRERDVAIKDVLYDLRYNLDKED